MVHIHWASHARNQWSLARLHIFSGNKLYGIHKYTVFFTILWKFMSDTITIWWKNTALKPYMRKKNWCLAWDAQCMCTIRGRTASCWYNSTFSRSFHSRAGVPQGACLSSTLFNIFVSGGVPFCSLTNYWGVGRWACFGHFCSKVHHHSIHPSICAI